MKIYSKLRGFPFLLACSAQQYVKIGTNKTNEMLTFGLDSIRAVLKINRRE